MFYDDMCQLIKENQSALSLTGFHKLCVCCRFYDDMCQLIKENQQGFEAELEELENIDVRTGRSKTTLYGVNHNKYYYVLHI